MSSDDNDSSDGVRLELRELKDVTAGRFDAMDTRFEGVDARFDSMEARLQRMADAQTRGFTDVIAEIRRQADRLDRRIDNVFVGALGKTVRDSDDAIRDLERRVTRLESAGDG